MEYIWQYLAIAVIFVVIDGIWLTLIAKKFYQKHLGYLLKPKASLLPAAIFYLLYVLGIQVFALRPALQSGELLQAAVYGGLLGLLMYATYDLTNQSTVKDWPLKVTLADLLWGTFVTAATTVAAFLIFN